MLFFSVIDVFMSLSCLIVMSLLCFCHHSTVPTFINIFFFIDPATPEIYTILFVGSVRCV